VKYLIGRVLTAAVAIEGRRLPLRSIIHLAAPIIIVIIVGSGLVREIGILVLVIAVVISTILIVGVG
jgi:hypothetical protein